MSNFSAPGICLCALAAAILGVSATPRAWSQGASGRTEMNHASRTAAGELPVVDLAGYQKLVAKYRGKPLLVTFWATWCEPCETEYPILVSLAKKYSEQGLAAFGLNMDDNSDLNLVRHFLAKTKPGFPNYRQKPGIDLDSFYRGVNPGWNGSMPETVFYNRDGSIAGHFIGLQPDEAYEREIRVILASPPATARQTAKPLSSAGE